MEVSSHGTAGDCWLVVYGKVFDLTDLAPEHPRGADFFLNRASESITLC